MMKGPAIVKTGVRRKSAVPHYMPGLPPLLRLKLAAETV